jgi:hypothetical protein
MTKSVRDTPNHLPLGFQKWHRPSSFLSGQATLRWRQRYSPAPFLLILRSNAVRDYQCTRLRIWGSGVRNSSGAPLSTRLRTPRLPALTCEEGLFEQLFVPLNTDLVIINFDDIDSDRRYPFRKATDPLLKCCRMVRPKRSINTGSIWI